MSTPDPIPGDFLPDDAACPGMVVSKPDELASSLLITHVERSMDRLTRAIAHRDSAWRTALRAERERWALTPGRICSYCGFVTDSHEQMVGHISECMKHPLAKLAEQYEGALAAERAAAAARVRAAVEECDLALGDYPTRKLWDEWLREHEPALSRELGAAESAVAAWREGEWGVKVYKYDIPWQSDTINMPEGARVLCVQVQHGAPHIWALVNPEAHTEPRRFTIYGTGHEVGPEAGRHIGTFQLEGGSLVFHVFEVAP